MTSRRSVMFAFTLAFAAFAATHLSSIPGSVRSLTAAMGGQPILDMKPSFSSDEVYQRLTGFGEAGRAAYRSTVLTTDVIFPLCVFVFLYILARYTADRLNLSDGHRSLLLGVPIAYFVSDMTENVAILALLSSYPDRQDLIGATIGYVTMVKRVAQGAAVFVPILLLVALRFRRRTHPV